MDQQETDAMELRTIAHHEAAHAVVTYRLVYHADTMVTIVPDAERGTLGSAQDWFSDSFNLDHLEARILSLYAGGHAQREVNPASGEDGCGQDEEEAALWLERCGWRDRE